MVLWHHDLAWTTPRYAAELHEGYPWNLLKEPWQGVTQVVVSALRQRELASLMGLPLDEIHVVPNGVDLAAFFKLEPWTQRLLEEERLLEADPLFLLPVRLTPRKNIELALTFLAALREIMPNARLLVSGPMGPHNPANLAYFDRLKTMRDALGLQGTAIFLAERSNAFLPDAVIADLYRLADALFFPSREEGFGIPMLEAGLSHLPIFAAEIDPLVQLGGDNVTWFSPDADPQALARRVAEIMQNSPVQGMARSARGYTWNRIRDTMIQPLLEEAVLKMAASRRSEID
jgi:glycosyltransferase involved in cell wall biosynthesis